jgi:hypothetical protein
MARSLELGALIGAALGFLFALAVVSFADCAGPHCAGERVVGLAGHAAGGAVIGAACGALAWGLWRLVRRGAR